MVFWFAVTFGGKHAYWMNVRKMLSGICIIDRTEMCEILNTYLLLKWKYIFWPISEKCFQKKMLGTAKRRAMALM